MTSNIDPTNPEHRVSDKHKPDKEKSWLIPPERDVWTLSDNAIRMEAQDLRSMFEILQQRDQELEKWEIEAMKTAVNCHADHVKYHHKSQDEILVPELRKRFKYPEKFATDHKHLGTLLDEVTRLVGNLEPHYKIDRVLEAWTAYESELLSLLKEEEEQALPLFRAYYTPKEAASITKKTLGKGPMVESGSLIRALGSETFKKEYMPHQCLPGYTWYVSYRPKYKAFKRDFIENVQAVKTGHRPSRTAAFTC